MFGTTQKMLSGGPAGTRPVRRLFAGLVLAAGVVAALLLSSSSASATSLDPGTRSPDPARIATGDGFGCAVDDGTVSCWGSGAYGELGTGDATDHSTPVAVNLGGTAIQVVAGDHHACALLGDGSVRCWGRNNDGQLGYGRSVTVTNGGPDAPGNPSSTPAVLGAVSLGRSAIAISAGGDNTCALLNNGLIRCWGNGASGEDGTGSTANVGDDEKPSDLSSIDLGNEAIAIATGASHSCALLDDGTVRCWGSAALGQLGYGNKTNIGDDESAGHGGAVDLGGPAVAISAGGIGYGDAQPGQTAGDHTCAVLSTGSVLCWGYGGDGALGNGSTANIGDNEKPGSGSVVTLGGGAPIQVTSVSVGADHTCGVLGDGTVRCWGSGANGQLGSGNTGSTSSAPTESVDVGGPVVAVSAGGSQTCARLGDGTIHCWGSGAGGQLGYGNADNVGDGVNGDATPASAGAVDTGATPEVRQVAAGTAHTCALASDGTVRCWGDGADGQLGYGNTQTIGDNMSDLPSTAGTVDVGGPVKEIAAGGNHTCALRADGAVYCWGQGNHGALGYGNTDNVGDGNGDKTPLSAGPVSLGEAAVAIVAGDSSAHKGDEHTCAILVDRGIRCWGLGNSGQLGTGDTNITQIGDSKVPSEVPEVSVGGEVRALSAGWADTCAILANGDSRCWGNNSSNQLGYGNTNNLGDNETPDQADPISLGAGRRAVGFAEGAGHTCAAMDNGAMRCWGSNFFGQLGYGNTNSSLGKASAANAVDLGSGRYSRLIDAGQTHTCVVMDNGQVDCWGYGQNGQLGYGNTDNVGDDKGETPAGRTVNVGAGRRVVSIALGDDHTCAVLDDGTLRCWGEGSNGRLGTGSTADVGDTAADVPGTLAPVDLFGDVAGSGDGGKVDQAIAFPAPIGVTYGDADFAPGATASSGLPVSVVSSTPGVCTVVGGLVHVVHAGSCSLTASQAGDQNTNAAPDQPVSFVIGKAPLTVTAPDASMTFGETVPAVSPSYDGFVGDDTAADLDTAPTCAADLGTLTTSCSGGVDGDYAFTYVDGHLTVNPVGQLVRLSVPGVVSYARASVPVTATSDSGGSVVLSASPARVCTVSGTALAIHAAGVCTVTGTQAGDAGHVPGSASLVVTVHPVPLRITAAGASAVVKGKLPRVAALFSGFVRGDSIFSLDRQPTCRAVRGKVRHVKRHGKKVTVARAGHTVCAGARSGDYAISYRQGRLRVARKGYAVTSPSRVYLRAGAHATVKLAAVGKRHTFKVTGKLPAGLRLVHNKSWSKVSIVGTPTVRGVRTVKVVVRSGKHTKAKQRLSLETD